MTIVRKRPVSGWTSGSVVTAAEFEHFDKYLSEAIHGKGGTYALDAPLVIGGDDIEFEENLVVGGNINVTGDVIIGDDVDIVGQIEVGASAVINGDLDVGGSLDVSGGAAFTDGVTFGANVDIAGSLEVTDVAIFSDDASFATDIDVAGSATIDGTLTLGGSLDANGNWFLGGVGTSGEIAGSTQLRGVLSHQGSGKIQWRQQTVSTDTDQTCIAALVDTFILPVSVFTAGHIVIIDDTGAGNGMRVNFRSFDTGGFLLTVRDPLGNNLAALNGVTRPWGYVERIAGVWKWFEGYTL